MQLWAEMEENTLHFLLSIYTSMYQGARANARAYGHF